MPRYLPKPRDKKRDALEAAIRKRMYSMVRQGRGWFAFCEPHVKEIAKNVKGGYCPAMSKKPLRCDFVLCAEDSTHEFYNCRRW